MVQNLRTGLIAKKIGMTRYFTPEGLHVPVTVLSLEGCQVIAQRTKARDGYVALQLGAGAKKSKNTSNPERVRFAKAQVEPKAVLHEFRVSEANMIEVGAEFTADHFVTGQRVDIQGTTIGKGFSGAMKRWNFGGMRATHGVSVSHRAHGSTGQRQDPGKTFAGKHMAGHYGVETVTTMNLEVVRIDIERGLVYIRGAVPGSEGSFVKVRDAVKKMPKDAPMPGKFKSSAALVVAQAAPAQEGAE